MTNYEWAIERVEYFTRAGAYWQTIAALRSTINRADRATALRLARHYYRWSRHWRKAAESLA